MSRIHRQAWEGGVSSSVRRACVREKRRALPTVWSAASGSDGALLRAPPSHRPPAAPRRDRWVRGHAANRYNSSRPAARAVGPRPTPLHPARRGGGGGARRHVRRGGGARPPHVAAGEAGKRSTTRPNAGGGERPRQTGAAGVDARPGCAATAVPTVPPHPPRWRGSTGEGFPAAAATGRRDSGSVTTDSGLGPSVTCPTVGPRVARSTAIIRQAGYRKNQGIQDTT